MGRPKAGTEKCEACGKWGLEVEMIYDADNDEYYCDEKCKEKGGDVG